MTESINDQIHKIACIIYFGKNEEVKTEWRQVQDPLFEKYNIDFHRSWCFLPLFEQEKALQQGIEILKKHNIKNPL